jgi:hypothetical protein
MISEQLGTDCASASDFEPSTACAAEGGDAGAAGLAHAAGEASGAGGSVYRAHGGCTLGRANESGGSRAWLIALAALSLSLLAQRRRS